MAATTPPIDAQTIPLIKTEIDAIAHFLDVHTSGS